MNIKSFFLGIGAGAFVGASLALIFAPSQGSVTRQHVKEVAESARHKASDIAAKAPFKPRRTIKQSI
ncbi:MAG: YtxH domain-containing protein [Armatimonadota bacterium]|nr:YtxH domain-containing protein [bacterium]